MSARSLYCKVACLLFSCALALGSLDGKAEPGSPDSYAPLFVMYSGSPSPEQIQALRGFLSANSMPGEVIQEAVDAVVYKLHTFKAGFAYPVYRSDQAHTGNACVIADSHHSDISSPWTLLASERVYRPLLEGRAAAIDRQTLLDNVIAHELFHCYDLMRSSLEEVGTRVSQEGSPYVAYWGEVGADVYAALQHLRLGGSKVLLRTIRDYRTVNLLNGDTVHYTAPALDYVIWHHDQKTLQGLSTRQLIALADRIRQTVAMTPDDFTATDRAVGRLSEEYSRAIADYPGLSKAYQGTLMTPIAGAAVPEHVGALFTLIAAALRNLGGDTGLGNPHFAPLIAKFDLGRRPLFRTAAAR